MDRTQTLVVVLAVAFLGLVLVTWLSSDLQSSVSRVAPEGGSRRR